ncbi:MATE efflux family protein [Legionella busanensis]|uniref:Multidrug-efflux transporter n=1 Tax=Legionella busanensis TaxID=190655 RepID=A0A378JQE8_9GAMM|nr:MATE family efflux transporter [Legionella busanensis]STX52399.1 MATE efflux family protein [Legionella busanensis]
MNLVKGNLYPLLKLALPLAATGLVQAGVFFFETIFLAHLGPTILAAGALVSWLTGTFAVIIFGVLSSINVLISHKFGAKDYQGIAEVIRDGIWLTFILVIPSMFLFWHMATIFLWLGQKKDIALLASSYLHALTFGILPNFIVTALLEIITGLGQTKLVFKLSLVSVCLTLFFSFALIFGKFGFPALGIAGAGWGLTTSSWLTMLILVSYLIINQKNKLYFKNLLTFSKPVYLFELIRVGAPMGFMYCIEVGFFFALTLIMGLFSSQMLAANQVSLQYLGALINIIFSLAQAITVRMGHLLGAGKKQAAEHAAYTGVVISFIFMFFVALIYWLFPTFLISIDFNLQETQNLTIIHYAIEFFSLCALFQIIEAVRIALFGALRSLKDTHFTLLISIISFWFIALPLGYSLATYFRMEGIGLWWGMIIGSVVSVILLFKRFKAKMANYYTYSV